MLSTPKWAYDVGYDVTICADAYNDPDPQAHAALLDETVSQAAGSGSGASPACCVGRDQRPAPVTEEPCSRPWQAPAIARLRWRC